MTGFADIDDREMRIEELIHALLESGDRDQADLSSRLWCCQRRRLDKLRGLCVEGSRPCRTVACAACRPAILAKMARRAVRFVQGHNNAACFHTTLVVASTNTLHAVDEIVAGAKIELRNLRDRHARQDRRWSSVGFVGGIEVDAVLQRDIPLLPPDRRDLIPILPEWSADRDHIEPGLRWIVHAHLICVAPMVPRGDLHDALAAQWPGMHRVYVQPFDLTRSVQANATYVGKYAHKAKMATEFAMISGSPVRPFVPWPMSWRCAWLGWIHYHRNGLAPLRIKIGPRRDTTTTSKVTRKNTLEEIAPMPMVF